MASVIFNSIFFLVLNAIVVNRTIPYGIRRLNLMALTQSVGTRNAERIQDEKSLVQRIRGLNGLSRAFPKHKAIWITGTITIRLVP